jgi:hypothetical protein
MIVGGTDIDGLEYSGGQYADWMTTFAPGSDVWVPADPSGGDTNAMRKGSGTSYGMYQICVCEFEGK